MKNKHIIKYKIVKRKQTNDTKLKPALKKIRTKNEMHFWIYNIFFTLIIHLMYVINIFKEKLIIKES